MNTEESLLANDPSCAPPRRKKTMTDAAIAANRANAMKSTGPRTEAGKLKSASNAFSHGIYSLARYENFCYHYDFVLEVVTNICEQFSPVTPTEHMLTEQLVHLQLRFLQMETYYSLLLVVPPQETLTNPPKMLNLVIRELNSLPGRINRQIKAIHAEQLRRADQARIAEDTFAQKFKFEPIEDQPPLPDPDPPPPYIQYGPEYKLTERLYDRFARYLNPRSQNGENEPKPDEPGFVKIDPEQQN